MNLIFVIPIFNDWESFRQLVARIDVTLTQMGCRATVLAVDDGSSDTMDGRNWDRDAFSGVDQVEIVTLACNLGHQKAIAVGLSVAAKREGFDAVVVMDGDGEDNPDELPHLIAALGQNGGSVVMAHRAKRSEGKVFRAFYLAYKSAFRLITGQSLSFGNYCVLSPKAAKRLTFMPSLWNSLPATCIRSRLPLSMVPTVRDRRYAGEPKMNFVSLILHGLQAITVFSDATLVRLALGSTFLGLISILILSILRVLHLSWLVPGWTSNMVGFVALSLLVILFGLLTTSLLTLQERSNMPMIPYVHGDLYVENIHGLWS